MNHPSVNPFQVPWMYNLLRDVPGYEPYFREVTDASGKVQGRLQALVIREGRGLKGSLSARAIVYEGPWISPEAKDKQQPFEALINGLLADLGRETIFFEFRNVYSFTPEQHAYMCEQGFRFHDEVNVIVRLDPSVNPLTNFKANRRWQVRKGLARGAVIISRPTKEQIDAFYAILQALYTTKVRKPLPDRRFFHALHKESRHSQDERWLFAPSETPPPRNKENGSSHTDTPSTAFLLVQHEGEIIGGVVLLLDADPDTGKVYVWYAAGRDKVFRGVYPSVLANWAGIHYAWLLGYRAFDFLGAGDPAIPYGVRDFKTTFGGKVTNHGRYLRINKPLLYHIGKQAVGVYSRLLFFR